MNTFNLFLIDVKAFNHFLIVVNAFNHFQRIYRSFEFVGLIIYHIWLHFSSFNICYLSRAVNHSLHMKVLSSFTVSCLFLVLPMYHIPFLPLPLPWSKSVFLLQNVSSFYIFGTFLLKRALRVFFLYMQIYSWRTWENQVKSMAPQELQGAKSFIGVILFFSFLKYHLSFKSLVQMFFIRKFLSCHIEILI